MFWSKILRFFSEDIAMDLGTANTLLYTRDGGIIVNEPSVVAIDTRNNEVLAVGSEAKRARGRTPKRIKTIRPMKSGVIADFDTTSRMIVYFVNKAIGRSHLVKPSLVISVPTGITGVEKKAVIDAAATAGAGRVSLIEEPMAAAIGADLPVTEPVGTLIADIGGGTSEVAVITMSAITVSQSIRIAGDAMNEILLRMLRDKYRLDVGENTPEHLKILLRSTQPGSAGLRRNLRPRPRERRAHDKKSDQRGRASRPEGARGGNRLRRHARAREDAAGTGSRYLHFGLLPRGRQLPPAGPAGTPL